MGFKKFNRPVMAPGFVGEDGQPYNPGEGEFIPLSDKGAAGGVATLDGSGKISAAELPPLQHDTAEAANEAAMLALDISAPAMVVRTDFSPPHIFFLTVDPATDIANWADTGELGAGAADPSVTIGLTAKNGVANTFMRSDAAPAIDQAITPTWSGLHTFAAGALMTGDTPTVYFGSTTDPTKPKIKAVDDHLFVMVADDSRLTAINAQAFLQGFLMPHSGGVSSPEYTSFDYDTSGMTFVSDTQWSLVLNGEEAVRVDTTVSNDLQFLLKGEMKLRWGSGQGTVDNSGPGLMSVGDALILLGDHFYADKYSVGQGSAIQSSADGIVQISNFAGTDFARLQFGGTTAAFPALKRGGAALEARTASDSAFTIMRGADPVGASDFATKGYADGLDAANAKLTGDQTIEGVKTFSSSPIVPVPDDGTQASNKNYVDAQITIVDQTIDARLSQAQRTAIDALTGGSSAAEIVSALQAA